jgi:hypothetical protein
MIIDYQHHNFSINSSSIFNTSLGFDNPIETAYFFTQTQIRTQDDNGGLLYYADITVQTYSNIFTLSFVLPTFVLQMPMVIYKDYAGCRNSMT